tara:strand:- start:246 stop:689 length:444 start_codon:yes stop_codon:yes gene_type:complete
MKLLKSHHNDFPEFYGEYCLADLNNCADPLRFDCETRAFRLESLEIDIVENGLTHPIILWDTKNTYTEWATNRGVAKLTPLYVQIGSQRAWVAKKLGYTHISAYNISSDEEMNRCNDVTLSQEYWEKRDTQDRPDYDVMDGITTRIM